MISSGAPWITWPCVVVHGLDQAFAVLRHGRPVVLLSAPGAALAGGCGWWHALAAAARSAHPATESIDILDCGAAPGLAMAALRLGQGQLVLDGACPAFAAVAAAAAVQGGVVLARRPPALDMAERGALRRLSSHVAVSCHRDRGCHLR